MVYTPNEFPASRSQGRRDLDAGLYRGRDVLFFETNHCERNTGRVKEVIVRDGLVSVSMLEGPYGNHRAYNDVRSLEGPYTYLVDRSTRHLNVTVHGSCKLVLQRDAKPIKLQGADIRMMTVLAERDFYPDDGKDDEDTKQETKGYK